MKNQFSQKTPWVDVKKRVEELHPDLVIVGGEESHTGNKSLIALKCKAFGHLIRGSIDSFIHKKKLMSCTACVNEKVGETIAVAVVHYLIGSTQNYFDVREITTTYLKADQTGGLGSLRHDAFFAHGQTDLNFDLALEHQGDQHINPNNKFHKWARNPKESFEKLQRSDQYKRDATLLKDVRLLEVPDLVVNAATLQEAVNLVIQTLRSKIKTEEIHEFEVRTKDLQIEPFVKNLLIQCGGESSRVRKLQAQLEKEDSPVQISSYDPISQFFKLFCNVHQISWKAKASNAIGSSEFGREGTRCPKCGLLARAEKRRLSFAELISAAEEKGFEPNFQESDYENNLKYLSWRCMKCGDEAMDSWAHISSDRNCKSCTKSLQLIRHAKNEMDSVRKIVEKNGDKLLSNETDYVNQNSVLRILCSRKGGCSQEFEMRAQKIKAGQLHSCDKHTRRALTTKSLLVKDESKMESNFDLFSSIEGHS
jgi:hypothetical protein